MVLHSARYIKTREGRTTKTFHPSIRDTVSLMETVLRQYLTSFKMKAPFLFFSHWLPEFIQAPVMRRKRRERVSRRTGSVNSSTVGFSRWNVKNWNLSKKQTTATILAQTCKHLKWLLVITPPLPPQPPGWSCWAWFSMIMLLSLELSSKLFPPGLKTLRGCFCFRMRKSYEYFIPISLKCDHGAKGCHVPTLPPHPLPPFSLSTNKPTRHDLHS